MYSFVSSLFLTSLDDLVCHLHCFITTLFTHAKKKKTGFLYLCNVLNTLKTKINLQFDYIHLLLLKECGVRPLPRSVGKCCFREVIAVGIVRTLTLRRLMSYIYMEHPFLMFLDHTQRRSTVGRTPLHE